MADVQYKKLPKSEYLVGSDGTIFKELRVINRGSKRTIVLKHPSGKRVRRDVYALVKVLFGSLRTK